MKKRLVIVGLMLFLAACMPTEQQEAVEGELTGTEGLSVQFMPNTPPPTVYDNTTDLPIMLLIENKGTYDNPQGTVYLSGFDPHIIEVNRNGTLPRDLPGRGPYIPRGQTHIMELPADITDISALRIDRYRTVLLATTCYDYETKVGTELCIDFRPFAIGQVQKICEPQDIILQGGQGAPVGVTQIEVEPGKGVTRLIIHVRNLGTGTVFKPGKLAQCNPYSEGLSYSDVDHIKIEEVRISNQNITNCQPNPVPLTGGEGLIFCTISEGMSAFQGITTAFISPINIKLKYGYRQSTTVPIEVKPSM